MPRLEIAEIADRAMKSPGGGPALLFEHVLLENGQRSAQPVAINLFGSMRRMCLALGTEKLDDIGGRISEMLNLKVPEGLFGKLAMLPKLAEIGKFPPRVKRGRPPCQEVVQRDDAVNLDEIPFLTTWPGDGGRYITLPMVITTDPSRGIRNVGMYRVQVIGRNTLAMHWQRHKVGAAHWREMAAQGRADAGGDRAGRRSRQHLLRLGAASAHDRRVPLCRFSPGGAGRAGQGGHLATSMCRPRRSWCSRDTSIRPRSWCWKGPSATTPASTRWPTTTPRCTSPRSHPAGIRSTRPPWWAGLRWRTSTSATPPSGSFLPLLKLTIPEIVDYHMPAPGIFHNLVFVSIDKQYPGQAYKVMNALWGQGLMSLAKVLVVVDKEVNVQDPDEAWWIALNNIDPERDVRFTMGPMDVLDHSSRAFTYGSKMGIDATRKVEGRGLRPGVARADHHGCGDQAAGG